MIFHFLIAICVFYVTALAAPQPAPQSAPQNSAISTPEPTITIYLPCPTDSTTLEPASERNVSPYPTIVKAPNTISTDTIYTNTNTYISPSINSISQSSKETEIVDPASTASNIAFSFMVIDGTTSWLNGQTPGDPTQSFAVVTSAVTVVPLSTPAPPPALLGSSSEDVVLSTVVVIPLSTPPTTSPSSPNTSGSTSEDVVLSTIVVVPLPMDSSHASSFTESNEPVVISTSTNTAPSTSLSSPSSTGTTLSLSGVSESSAIYSKISSSSSSFRSSISVSEPSSRFITSSILGSSLGVDSSSTIRDSSSSTPLASSPTISKPASTKSTYQLMPSSEPEPSSTSESISSTGVSGMLFVSLTANVSSSSTPSSSSRIEIPNASVPFASIPTVSKLVSANSTNPLVSTSAPTSSSTSATRSSTGVSGISSGSITGSIFGSSGISSFSASGNFSSSVPLTSSLHSASSTTISKPESANLTNTLASSGVTSQTTPSSGPVIITIKTTVELSLPTSTPASTPSITSSRASLGIATTTGKVYTFAPGGWNASLLSKSESSFNIYTSFTLGTLTTLKAAGGFKDDQSATLVPANLTTLTSSFSSQTSILSSTSSSNITSMSGMGSMSDATSIASSTSYSNINSMPSMTSVSDTSILRSTSSSNIASMPSMVSMSDATSTGKLIQSVNATSISNSILLSNTTSSLPYIPLSTASPISSFISVTIGSSSAHFSNSTSAVSTSTSISSIVASTTPSDCGERGGFVLTFDDVPPLSVSNTSDTDVQPEPLFNPYHQFLFSDGFTVVPPPKRLPFLPSSSPLLLEFIPNFTANVSNRQTGPNAADHGFSGQIGSGDEGLTGCFNFNLYGASLGCDSIGPACDFTFTGYSYDVASKVTSQVTQQVVNVPACPGLSKCTLTRVDLDSSFKDLAYFFMNVTVAGKPKLWWMDDLRLGWFDNTCTTGLCRQSAHLH